MKRLLILTAVFGLLAVTVVAVQAGGAEVDHRSEWYEFSGGYCYPYYLDPVNYDFCYDYRSDGHLVSSWIDTPSGNTKIQWSDHFDHYFHSWLVHRDTGEITEMHESTDKVKFHSNLLYKGDMEEMHVAHHNDKILQDTGIETCVIQAIYHIVDGQVRIDKHDIDCEPN